MEYAILIHEPATDFALREDPEKAPAYWAGWSAYAKALTEAGVMRGGAGLMAPSAAATVRLRGDQRHVQDGPFADTKEMLGGFFLIEAASLEEAIAWAARCPAAATGAVEVRPRLPNMS